ncbi:MAG TPA: hypothetical protein VIM58_02970 [Candidatus Methylacidiphilales bacterium]
MKTRFPSSKAFFMVEVVMAIGVLTFAVLMLIALVPLGLRTNDDTSREGSSINIIGSLIADWRSVGLTANATPRFHMPALAPTMKTSDTLWIADSGASTSEAEGRYRVDYRVTPPPSTNSFSPYYVAVTVSWPARAAVPVGKVEATAALPSR